MNQTDNRFYREPQKKFKYNKIEVVKPANISSTFCKEILSLNPYSGNFHQELLNLISKKI